MTKLPEKNILDGSKLPKTTTGEMKDALGKLRDYLNELLGEDSTDKEAARLALGIDLAELTAKIGTRAERTELENRTQELEKEIAKRGVPIGSIDWLAVVTPPAGYLKADGSAIGRATYPYLFAAIGTTFGEGDGETTFNLPNLIGRFAEGSATPGTVKEAGLPNITGYSDVAGVASKQAFAGGAFIQNRFTLGVDYSAIGSEYNDLTTVSIDASRSNSIYGASDTVQPPALTLLPCIKAFDAAVNPGLVDMTELAQEMANKADKSQVINLVMPSQRYTDLAIAADTNYVAPADGYVYAYAQTSQGGFTLINASTNLRDTSVSERMWGLCCCLPVQKGDIFLFNYWQTMPTFFRFIYAEGSQP